MTRHIAFIIVASLVLLNSCSNHSEKKSENGLRYIIHIHGPEGKKIEPGNYVTLTMTYKDDRDSVLYDSKISGNALRFQLDKIPFKGSFEDGLTLLTTGDSASFFVSADSMYHYMFELRGSHVMQDQTAFKKNSFVRFNVKVLAVQDYIQAEQEIEMHLSEQEKKERILLIKYISEHQIITPPDSAGYYLIMKERGKGNAVDSGKIITLEYEGRFLDETVFDGTKKAGRPYRFMSGAHHVISGWELALKKLRQGDKFTLILPSKLGYGADGIRNPSTGKYIVPPYTPLIFDISIEEVEEMSSVTGL